MLYLGCHWCSVIFYIHILFFITGNFSYYPIIIGIPPIGKMYLSHYGKCKLLYLMLCFAT